MHFFAIIDIRSAIHQRWRGENRISGMLSNSLFVWNNDLHRYETTELEAAKVEIFRARSDQVVKLEVVHVLPEAPSPQGSLSDNIEQQVPILQRSSKRRRLVE